MDDGSKIKNGIHLNTYGFTLQEVELLVKVLINKFGLKCSIHMKNNQPRPGGPYPAGQVPRG